jgi:hypothetical protein
MVVILSVVSKQRVKHNMWTEITRPQYDRSELRYASDVTDGERKLIAPNLPAARRLLVGVMVHAADIQDRDAAR